MLITEKILIEMFRFPGKQCSYIASVGLRINGGDGDISLVDSNL